MKIYNKKLYFYRIKDIKNMTETYLINQSHSKLSKSPKESSLIDSSDKNKHKSALSSSSLDSSFENINDEIKSIIENEHDLSFSSDSNSELAENKADMEYLFNHKFWKVNNNSNSSKSNEKNQRAQSPIQIFKTTKKQSKGGISEGSNKQSTQSNEDEETPAEHFQNISSFESNNNSSLHNESEEKEKRNEEIKKEKEDNNINNSNQNLKYIYPYENRNYKNNNIQFFPGVYYPPQMYSFMPNYNYPSLNKKNFITNHNNNLNNKIEGNNSSEKNDLIKINTNIKGQNQYINPYMNNYNKKMNQNQMEIKDLPLVINNIHNSPMNYPCQKINFNMICCPQIQPVNTQIQKQSNDKINTSSNFLPEINHKENTKTLNQEKKINKNSSNNNPINNNSINMNVCPIIGKGNNEIKINNKSFVNNKSNNACIKGNLKGEKQILNLDDIVTGKDTRTTVMIRNIPIKYTDQILTNALNEFNGKYDCLYMPYDYEKNGNKGYAFINFVNPLHILYFYEKFNGKKWIHFESSKICELNVAHFQGINEIQKHAKNYKGQKKPNYYSIDENENMIIPLKYLYKLQKRFPKMKYVENKGQNTFVVKSFE